MAKRLENPLITNASFVNSSIDLAFPLDGRGGGPPFGTSETEILNLFEARGFELDWEEAPPDSVSRRREAEKLFVFRKAK